MLTRIITAGSLALLLTACGSMPTRVALEPATTQKLKEVKVLSILPQDEVIVRAESFGATAALGGGLIGALIDSKVAEGRQNTLQEVMAPFYQAVDDYDFRTRFERTLATTLEGSTRVKFSPLERTTLIPLPKDVTARIATLQAGNAQMLVRTVYAFTTDFTRLNVNSHVEIKLPGAETPAFLNTYFYQSKATGGGGADSIKNWSSSKGEAYRTTLDEAAQEMGRMLQLDLAASAADPQDAAKASVEKVDGSAKQTITGAVLASSAGRKIIRNATGNVYSLPQ